MGLLQYIACMEEEEEEVGHKIPMVTGSEDGEHVEVLGCLSVLLNVADLCHWCSLKRQRITCLFNWYFRCR